MVGNSPALAELVVRVEEKRRQLGALLPHAKLGNFEHTNDLELTYSSNAIEGNTLTASETMLVIEQGITIGGKPLKDHLEALDHWDALRYVREIAHRPEPLTEMDVRRLHALVMQRSRPELAGRYAVAGRYVLTDTGRFAFPLPAEVPALMGDFARRLGACPPSAQAAFDAHRSLVAIHPFDDGNGRTARLLMNLLLIRAGYPPVAIRPVDRPAYLRSLQLAGTEGPAGAFNQLLYERLEATLDEHLHAAQAVSIDIKDRGS